MSTFEYNQKVFKKNFKDQIFRRIKRDRMIILYRHVFTS